MRCQTSTGRMNLGITRYIPVQAESLLAVALLSLSAHAKPVQIQIPQLVARA